MIEYFCLRDKKLGSFMSLFPVKEGVKKVVVDLERAYKEGQFKYPEDYELWKIGSFDEENGRFDINNCPLKIASFDSEGRAI